MTLTLGELERLEKKEVVAPKTQKRDPVAEFKKMEGIKRGLPKGLRDKVEKRGAKNVQALKAVARQVALRKKNASIRGLPEMFKPHANGAPMMSNVPRVDQVVSIDQRKMDKIVSIDQRTNRLAKRVSRRVVKRMRTSSSKI